MKRLLIVPLDNRPCTYRLPQQIARVAGWEAEAPPIDLMGDLQRLADRRAIASWLRDRAQGDVAGIVVGLETLGYGGLIPSRRLPGAPEDILSYLNVLRNLREQFPQMPIYAFSVLMRISDSNVNEEEKFYWSDFGKLIHRYSVLYHRCYPDAVEHLDFDMTRYATGEVCFPEFVPHHDRDELTDLHARIPREILRDYVAGRHRNFQVNQMMLDWLGEGVFDFLALTMDDTTPHGFNVIERQCLEQKIAEKKLSDRSAIYPGADEVASVLTARLMAKSEGFFPSFTCTYSTPAGAIARTMYEDRPLGESVAAQVAAAGACLRDENPDIHLFIHSPENSGGDGYLREHLPERSSCESPGFQSHFWEPLFATSEKGLTALADVAWANGADPDLMTRLRETNRLPHLAAYGAWNTAGNTLGTVIAHAIARQIARRHGMTKTLEQAHQTLLFERFADDYLYQSDVRPYYGAHFSPDLARTELTQEINDFFHQSWQGRSLGSDFQITGYHCGEIRFPWNRQFEVDIPLTVEVTPR